RMIRRRMPLPAGPPTRGAPEFEALRQALRELATALEAARERELEAERLRAFREVARRVAHEIKNPLTAMRIAVDQVGRTAAPAGVREPAAQRLGGDGRARIDRDRREPGRERVGGDDRRPWRRHPGRPAPARVRAVFHDQTGRHGSGARSCAPDDRGPQREHHRGGDAGRRRHVLHRPVRRVSPRVLLVDDETNIRKMVAALLESEGFETAEAANGSAGVAEVERDAPDAVLLDLMMPGGPDGLATLEQLKRVAPDLPVVMMSGK